MRRAIGMLGLLVLVGCERGGHRAVDAGLAEADAGPPRPAVLKLTVKEQLLDGGVQAIDFDSGKPLVEPATALDVTSNLVVRDYRVRLLDEQERLVPSDDTSEDTPEGLKYHITLTTPLKTGWKYALVVEPDRGSQLTDTQGGPQPEQRLEFQIVGEKEKPPPPPKVAAGKGKRRRR